MNITQTITQSDATAPARCTACDAAVWYVAPFVGIALWFGIIKAALWLIGGAL